MSFKEHREKLYRTLEENTLVIAYAGVPLHANEDDYHDFVVNSQYFYLTGVTRENTAFLAYKSAEKTTEILFIEEPDPNSERWTGKMPTKEEVKSISGIEDVRYADSMESDKHVHEPLPRGAGVLRHVPLRDERPARL